MNAMRPFNKKFILLFFCLVISTGLVFILFRYSKRANHKNNAFSRLFPPHFLSNPKQLELKYNSFYLAGFSKTNIFLGNITAAAFLLKTNYDLTDSGHIILQVPPETGVVADAIQVFVDSPDIYMMEGVTPRVLHGSLLDPHMADMGYHGLPFNSVSIISNQTFALRTYDPSLEENIMAKSTIGPGKTQRFPGILTRRGDGVFSLDGNLIRDPHSRNLVYVYFYRNEFLYMDSNLNILMKGKTIDSIHTPQLKVARILSAGTITFSAPRLIVNRSSCADSGFLFVNSGLRARNEYEVSFDENSVIDIYSLKNGEYLYSFYVPDDHHVKMRSFQVFNHRLIVLYDHSISTFSMNF
jgi:hypothetical protein